MFSVGVALCAPDGAADTQKHLGCFKSHLGGTETLSDQSSVLCNKLFRILCNNTPILEIDTLTLDKPTPELTF